MFVCFNFLGIVSLTCFVEKQSAEPTTSVGYKGRQFTFLNRLKVGLS